MHKIRVAMMAAALAASTGSALAEPFWLYDRNATTPMTPGRAYIGFLASGGVQQMPTFNGTVTLSPNVGGSAPVFRSSFDFDARGVSPGGVVGYVFRDGMLPPWLGQRFRVEVSGSMTSLHSEADASFHNPTTLLVIAVPGIGGRSLCGACGVFRQYSEHFEFRREAFGLRLRAATDYALGPNLSFSPGISVFGGRTSDSYEYSFLGQDGVAPGQVNERVRTTEFGGSLNGTLAWQFADGFALNLGGHAGVVHLDSRLTGTDCFNFAAVPAPCGPSNTLTNPSGVVSTSVTDSRSTVGFRGGASLSLSADFRFMIATVGGYFQYDSRIPGVENPQRTSFAAFTTNAPARVKFDSGFGYGGFLVFRVPLVVGL